MAKGLIDINGKKVEFEPPAPSAEKRGGIYAGTVENTDGMAEVVVGKDGKGYVNPYWKLIKKVKLEEAVSSIEINENDDENINSYNRFRIIFPIVNMTKANTVWVRLYDRSGIFNFAATMDVESDSKIKFEIPIINKDYIYMETLGRKGTGTTSAACLTRETQVASSDGVVNKIRIDSSFDKGTEVYVYGGTDE